MLIWISATYLAFGLAAALVLLRKAHVTPPPGLAWRLLAVTLLTLLWLPMLLATGIKFTRKEGR